MKKLLIIVAILAISASSFAQVKFGAKAGVNIANLNVSDVDYDPSFDSKTGLTIGAFAKYSVSEKFAVQPELLYTQKGAIEKDNEGEYTYKSTYKLNYISLPVIAKYYVASGFSIQAGPQIDFRLSSKLEDEMSGPNSSSSETIDFKDKTNLIDFGLAFGLGYELDMGLGFDARYMLGLTEIVKDPMEGTKTKSKGFQITASYAF